MTGSIVEDKIISLPSINNSTELRFILLNAKRTSGLLCKPFADDFRDIGPQDFDRNFPAVG